jgi:hypothetical protein
MLAESVPFCRAQIIYPFPETADAQCGKRRNNGIRTGAQRQRRHDLACPYLHGVAVVRACRKIDGKGEKRAGRVDEGVLPAGLRQVHRAASRRSKDVLYHDGLYRCGVYG